MWVRYVNVGVHHSNEGADVLSVDVDPAGKLLVTGDSKGNLRLYNHPCQSSGVSSVFVWKNAACSSDGSF